jgi:hypothetical protein
MEGLTITPDGSTLVGIMQSALQQTDLASFDAKKLTPLRIVTYDLATGVTHEYLYLLDNPDSTKTAVSEIAALSNTTFLVDERDGNFPPGAYKKLYKIDITGATDVGPGASVPGASYNGAAGGLLVGGKTIELLVKGQDTALSQGTLIGNGITPVGKSLHADIGALLLEIDATGAFFSHDKIEGVAVLDGGTSVVITNDSDFGIDGVTNTVPPFILHAKTSPVTGLQDEGEFLRIDLTRTPAALSTTTVTIKTVDTVAPETVVDSVPSNPTNSPFAMFGFHGTDAGTLNPGFECLLDGAPAFTACVPGVMYSNLVDGGHSFAVRAVDGAGNKDQSPATYAWTIDTAPPNTAFDSTPANPSPQGMVATFAFHGTDVGVGIGGFQCSLDGAAPFTPCGTGISNSSLAVGVHTFKVRAVDKAGNADPTPATYSWTVLGVPHSTDDCKDDNWRHLVRADGSPFKNQGACVSYVNTGE